MRGYKEYKIFDILKRKGIILRYIALIIINLAILITAIFLITTTKKEVYKSIEYIENSNLDYKVYLKENEFFEEEYLGKDNQYIASIIDYIATDFNYQLSASEPNIEYRYSYKIVATVNVENRINHNSLYKMEEELVVKNGCVANTSKKLDIKELVNIDYNKYNDIISKFIDMYDLESVNCTLELNMYINLLDLIKPVNAENTPALSMTIPLTTKTIAIDFESNIVNENKINVSKITNINKYLFILAILFVIDVLVIIKLVTFIKDMKDEKSLYNMKVRKITSNYGSYIQKINNDFSFNNYKILEIDSFKDLLQVKETINKPILMTEKESDMETNFFIPNNEIVYLYKLNIKELQETKKIKDIKENKTLKKVTKESKPKVKEAKDNLKQSKDSKDNKKEIKQKNK